MNYGILAAGEGSRLQKEGIGTPKPLVTIGGEKLLLRQCRLMASPATESLHIFTRRDVRAQAGREVELIEGNSAFICPEEPTESSLHSCDQLLASYPRRIGKLVITTVDTVIRDSDWFAYIRAFEQTSADAVDGLFVVTPWVDDESPLFVLVDMDTQDILAFVDDPTDIQHSLGTREDGTKRRTRLYVSGGVYGFCCPHEAHQLMRRCLRRGESRMRNYQRSLLRAHFHLKAFVIDQVFDVDHADDVRKAEEFLARR